LMRSPGLVATQTLTFLFTDIEGWAEMGQRRGDAHAGVLAGHHRLNRAGLAGDGAEKSSPGAMGVTRCSLRRVGTARWTVAHGG
jgi:hypothetical protein